MPHAGLRGEVDQFLTEQMASLPEGAGGKDEPLDPGFSLGSQMVLQLAATHVQTSGRKEMNGGNVLIALFRDEDSHAAWFLQQQGVSRFEIGRAHV